ncbi:MAG: hypothetical protein K1X83_03635 [Oligoflexia bacterium]|nr:hypothetical protein [Oligoflexia bacterium]
MVGKCIQARLNALFLFFGLLFLVASFGFQQFEAARAREVLQRETAAFLANTEKLFNSILEIESVSLNALSDSFAYWDEVVTFIEKNDIEWAANNLDSGFSTFQAQAMWVYDLKGNIVYYSDTFEDHDLENVAPPGEIVIEWENSLATKHAFASTPYGPLEFVGFPVQNTADPTRKSPAKGYLISGRLWDQSYSEKLQSLTGTTISTNLGDSASGADFTVPLKNYQGETVYTLGIKSTATSQTAPDSGWKQSAISFAFILLLFGTLHILLRRWVTVPLRSLAGELSEQVALISSVASELDHSSESLAHGTSNQTESVQRTSAAVEEISAGSLETADHAGVTVSAMTNLQKISEDGYSTVQLMSDTIGRIKSAASEAEQIIKTIDEIAFQTNLLALNAAVEAARAGDSGKGFAVVAEEVRGLARRSAEAAKTTTEKLSRAREQTEEGASVVQGVHEVFVRIGNEARHVTELIERISNASKEQSLGLKEISNAVVTIDQVTTQTSSIAQSASKASATLNDEAAELHHIATAFRELVGQQSAAAPVPEPEHTSTGC